MWDTNEQQKQVSKKAAFSLKKAAIFGTKFHTSHGHVWFVENWVLNGFNKGPNSW